MKALLKKLSSRKFLFALIAFLVVLLCRAFTVELPKDLEVALIGIVITYLLAEGYIDSKRVEIEEETKRDVEL
jgi:hypothetical protein